MTATETQALLDRTNCYACLGLSMDQLLSLGALQEWMLSVNPGADTSTDALLESVACVRCYGASFYDLLEIAMLAQIAGPVASFLQRAGITDETEIAAVNALVTAAQEHGWWELCDLIYPFVGGNATAHAQNLKSSDFTITWNGTVTHDANGVTGNGTDGYGATGYQPDSDGIMELNSVHFSTYMRVAGTISRYDMGCSDGVNRLTWLTSGVASGRMAGAFNNTTDAVVVNALNANFKLTAGTRRDAVNVFGYNTVSGERTVAGVPIAMPVGVELFVLALNTSGVASLFQDKNIALLTAGGAIDSLATFNAMAADIQTFQTTLGRQV